MESEDHLVRDYVYLSGPITGVDNWQEPFNHAAERIRRVAPELHVISPVVLDAELERWMAPNPPSREDYMRFDLNTMLDLCDHIVMLPGWQGSRGATIERLVAKACGLTVWYSVEDLLHANI